ncbi:MAG: hypothetical protein HXS44_13475 [Theionarchaea archaeon]|nr:hypothetical protein [Theionarchaea archaeon]
MRKVMCVVCLSVVGCLYQGVNSVYYVMVETEPYYEDGVQKGVYVFLVFKDRNMEIVHFYDAECKGVISVESDGLRYEKEVVFDSSELVGIKGGILILKEEVKSEYGDITAKVTIEGRGEFHSEKKNVRIG